MPSTDKVKVQLNAVVPRAPYVLSFRHPGDHTVMTHTGSLSQLEAAVIKLRLLSAERQGLIEEGRIQPVAPQPPSDFIALSRAIPGWDRESRIDSRIATATTIEE